MVVMKDQYTKTSLSAEQLFRLTGILQLGKHCFTVFGRTIFVIENNGLIAGFCRGRRLLMRTFAHLGMDLLQSRFQNRFGLSIVYNLKDGLEMAFPLFFFHMVFFGLHSKDSLTFVCLYKST